MMGFGRKKNNYLIVCHCYFMTHREWHQKLLLDVTEREAKAEAALFAKENEANCDFEHSDAKAFLLPDVVQVYKDRVTPPIEDKP